MRGWECISLLACHAKCTQTYAADIMGICVVGWVVGCSDFWCNERMMRHHGAFGPCVRCRWFFGDRTHGRQNGFSWKYPARQTSARAYGNFNVSDQTLCRAIRAKHDALCGNTHARIEDRLLATTIHSTVSRMPPAKYGPRRRTGRCSGCGKLRTIYITRILEMIFRFARRGMCSRCVYMFIMHSARKMFRNESDMLWQMMAAFEFVYSFVTLHAERICQKSIFKLSHHLTNSSDVYSQPEQKTKSKRGWDKNARKRSARTNLRISNDTAFHFSFKLWFVANPANMWINNCTGCYSRPV